MSLLGGIVGVVLAKYLFVPGMVKGMSTTPMAPLVRCARLRASSPLNHSRSVCRMMSAAANRSPFASLTATMPTPCLLVGGQLPAPTGK